MIQKGTLILRSSHILRGLERGFWCSRVLEGIRRFRSRVQDQGVSIQGLGAGGGGGFRVLGMRFRVEGWFQGPAAL